MLRTAFISFIFLSFLQQVSAQDDWDAVKEIEKNIHAPVFKNKDYHITSSGSDARTAINNAIAKCSAQGGGRVIVPAGKYNIKGPLLLKSNVNLHFNEGAELNFSSNADDYLPVVFTRWEGTELYNYSPLIYAYKASNIAVIGKGLLNGRGLDNFATWKPQQKKDQQDLREMGRTGVPVKQRVFGKGHFLRRSQCFC